MNLLAQYQRNLGRFIPLQLCWYFFYVCIIYRYLYLQKISMHMFLCKYICVDTDMDIYVF